MVKQVPILNFQNSIFCLKPNLYVIKESPNQIEVVIYTQKCPKKEVKVRYFGCLSAKSLEIPIKSAIFRLKISDDDKVWQWWLLFIKYTFIYELKVALVPTSPNPSYFGQWSKICRPLLWILDEIHTFGPGW